MNHYEILGVTEGASKEEIKKAYEERLYKIEIEVLDQRRSKLFMRVLNEAYEALINKDFNKKVEKADNMFIDNELDNSEEEMFKTVVMSQVEIQNEIEKEIEKQMESKTVSVKTYSDSSENKRKQKNNKSTSSTKSTSKKKNKAKEKIENKDREEKDIDKIKEGKKEGTKVKVIKEDKNNSSNMILSILLLPLKIIAVPIIIILSIIIFLCKIISIVSWIASKVVIVGGIGLGAIHVYQVYLGQAADKKLLVLAATAVVVSFFLPSILRVIPNILGSLNKGLKDFVF